MQQSYRPVHNLPASMSPLFSFFQASCVSLITFSASLALKNFSSYPNPFNGLSSGVLYQRNHSRIPDFTESGTSSISLYSAANGSSLAIASTFQSNSPSSIIANTPNGFTSTTLPIDKALEPISTTSIGSSSPLTFNSGCSSLGSSHVCGIHP